MSSAPFDLCLITDPSAPGGLVGSVESALAGFDHGPALAVQLRAKSLTPERLRDVGERLRTVTRQARVTLLVNGSCQLATAIEADGVQLPERGLTVVQARQQLGPKALIGRSCHDLRGLRAAVAADFVTLSPFFPVPGKNPPLSESHARDLCARSPRPVIALGGIGHAQVETALACGAVGVAVIRAVFWAEQPGRAVAALLDRVRVARAAYSERPTA